LNLICLHTILTSLVVKSPAEATGMYDYVVCAHKAIDQDSVPEKLSSIVDRRRTTLVIIQNGVGNEEPFRNAFSECTIITCVVCARYYDVLEKVTDHG
jgi:ketopantoate reductase